jgi:hypothetical protein
MFTEGQLLYITPFYFKNGNPAKPKYFLVLKNDANLTILASLLTRKDHIPIKETIDFGCIELQTINLNCFVIPPKKEITICHKSFDFATHIYGHQIDLYDANQLKEMYAIEGSDYVIFGQILPEIFKEIIVCLRNSKSVKKKFVRMLL